MTRRLVHAGRVCVFVMAIAAFVSPLTLNALPFLNAADKSGEHDAGSSAVFLVAPSVAVSGQPVSIATGDLNGDGVPDLIVANAQTSTVDVLLGDGKGNFLPPVHYKVGGSPVALVLGDFSGHGKIDLAVANQFANSVSVLLGKGDGTFQGASSYAVGVSPVALAIGDFDGDGHTDLLVANGGSNSLALLTNKGDGTFQSAKSYSLTASPRTIAVGDLNSDGSLDAVSGNADGSVNPLLNDGSGKLTVVSSFQAAGVLSAIAIGDLNRDGKPDLAVADSAANAVTVFLGNGDGSFQSQSVLATGNGPAALAINDINGDGIPDVLVANKSGNTVSVMLGAGGGTFRPGVDYVVGNSPVAITVADFNGDGHLDFATSNFGDGTITTPLGNGDGTFAAAQNYRTHLERKSVAVGDLDGDGHPDLVVASFCGINISCSENGTASVFLSDGHGGVRAGSTYALGKGPISVLLADVNGDKKLDLIAVNRDDNSVMVLLGNGDGTFQQAVSYPSGGSSVSVAAGDFNNDGNIDLAVASLCGSAGCNQQGSVSILLGNGDGSFKAASSYDVGFSPVSVAVGDVNGDGKLDLVVANACGKGGTCSNGTATVLLGDGKGGFALLGEADLGKSVTSIALADLNKDGKLDLVAASSVDNKVGVLLGNGDGTFPQQTVYRVGKAPSSVIVGDFDGDGVVDVAVANLKDSTVSLLHGNGDGTLAAAVAYPVGFGPDALAALDLIGSGRLAVVTANGNSGGSPLGNDITVLGNAGSDGPQTANFSLALAPTSGDVTRGGSATTTVTGTPSGGYTGTITLSCSSGLPTGAACTFNPTQLVLPGGPTSSTLTISTTASGANATPGGSYSITVEGTDGTLTHETVPPFTLNVLTISPTSQSVEVNETQLFTASVSVSWSLSLGGKSCTAAVCGTVSPTTGTSTTYTAPNGVASGPITLTATTSGTPAATATATITITDFTLGLNPTSSDIAPGQSAITTVTASDVGGNGYTGTITLSCPGLPATITCTFNPTQLKLPGGPTSSQLTIATTGSTPAGTYVITVRGKDAANVFHDQTFTLNLVTVTVSPGSATVEVNQMQGFTASVTPSQTITWSLTGTNCAGAACGSVSPKTGTTTTYTAPGAAPLGTVTLTATAADGVTGTASITVTDFKLAVSPTFFYVVPGGSTITTAKGSAFNANGYAGTITLSCPGLPATITCTFNPPQLILPGGPTSSQLTISTTSSTPANSYTLTINGTDAAAKPVSHTTSFNLYVVTVAIEPPNPLIEEVQQMPPFTATVNGAPPTPSVVWTLACAGGNACGTLTNAKPLGVTYNAPATTATGLMAALTATFSALNGDGTTFTTHGSTPFFNITDFAVMLSSASGIVTEGNSTTTALNTAGINGYVTPLPFTNSCVVSGTTDQSLPPVCSVSRSGNVPESTPVDITTSVGTETGLYALTLTGMDSAPIPVSHFAAYSLAIQCAYSVGNSNTASTVPTFTPGTSSPTGGAITPTLSFSVTETSGGSNCTYGKAVAGGFTASQVTATGGVAGNLTFPSTSATTGTATSTGTPVTYNLAGLVSNATPLFYTIKTSYFQGGPPAGGFAPGIFSSNFYVTQEALQTQSSFPGANAVLTNFTVSAGGMNANPNNNGSSGTSNQLSFVGASTQGDIVCSAAQEQSDGTFKLDPNNNNWGITCVSPTIFPLDGASDPVAVTLNLSQNIPTSSLRLGRRNVPQFALVLGLPGLLFLSVGVSVFAPMRGKRNLSALSLLLLVVLLAFLPACGGGINGAINPPGSGTGTYVVTVMGTVIDKNSGNVIGVEIFSVTLTVTPKG